MNQQQIDHKSVLYDYLDILSQLEEELQPWVLTETAQNVYSTPSDYSEWELDEGIGELFNQLIKGLGFNPDSVDKLVSGLEFSYRKGQVHSPNYDPVKDPVLQQVLEEGRIVPPSSPMSRRLHDKQRGIIEGGNLSLIKRTHFEKFLEDHPGYANQLDDFLEPLLLAAYNKGIEYFQ